MSPEQSRVQDSADHLSKAMFEFSNHIDKNGATLTEQTKRLASTFDRETLVFLNKCDLYSKSVSAIRWNGQTTPLMGLVLSLNGFMKHVHQLNGYRFNSAKWFG